MSDDRRPDKLAPSIYEEALARFSESDDSLAGVVNEYDIGVRDFMILSLVCDQRAMSIDQLSSALGLTRSSMIDCVGRLIQASLAEADLRNDPYQSTNRVVPTPSGTLLVRRILGE